MPIAMTKDEWSKITKWTDSNREDPEVVRRREYVKYLDETSSNMTKQWPNSLENVNKRSEELRRARTEAAEQANSRFYQQYLKKKRQEQRELMYSARETVFKNKDAPKLLLSAVIETVIQKEREEQIKFNHQLKTLDDEQKRKDDNDVIRKAKEWHELDELRKQRRFEVNKKHQKEILEQADEISERNRKEYETELEMQKIDNIRANEEMDELKKFEEDFKSAEKARILSDMKRARAECQHRRREAEARDKCDDKLIQVLQRATARVERRRKQTESDLKADKQRVLEEISKKLETGDAAREEKEEQNLRKAIQEKEATAVARRAADASKKEKFKEERKQVREAFLAAEEKRIHDFNTVRQWEIMNRFKNAELYEDFKEKLNEEKERKVREYREDILKLWKERDEREAKERADTRYFYGELAEKKIRDADNKLLTLGGKLLDEARANDRPEFALHKAIDRYCKQNRLCPMPPLPRSMQEHFVHYGPKDMTKPDSDYRYPDPPTEEKKRDGLQPTTTALAVAGPSKPECEEPNTNYKRKGPANGLQTKSVPPPTPGKARERCPCQAKK